MPSKIKRLNTRLCIDFGNLGLTNHLNGHFTETGVARMLEASVFEAVDIEFTSLLVIVYEYCNFNETADITDMFPNHAHMVSLIYRHCCSPGWSEEKLDILCRWNRFSGALIC